VQEEGAKWVGRPAGNNGSSQGAYNSGIRGNLKELVNSGKLREFKIYSGNLSDACCFFVTQSETHRR